MPLFLSVGINRATFGYRQHIVQDTRISRELTSMLPELKKDINLYLFRIAPGRQQVGNHLLYRWMKIPDEFIQILILSVTKSANQFGQCLQVFGQAHFFTSSFYLYKRNQTGQSFRIRMLFSNNGRNALAAGYPRFSTQNKKPYHLPVRLFAKQAFTRWRPGRCGPGPPG